MEVKYQPNNYGFYGFNSYADYRDYMDSLSKDEQLDFHQKWDDAQKAYYGIIRNYYTTMMDLKNNIVKQAFDLINSKDVEFTKDSRLKLLFESVMELDKFNRKDIPQEVKEYGSS